MVSGRFGKKEKKDGRSSTTQGAKLIQHKHCQICGKAQLVEAGDVCSEGCQKTLDDNIKRKKMWWVYMILLMAVLVVLFFVVPYFF